MATNQSSSNSQSEEDICLIDLSMVPGGVHLLNIPGSNSHPNPHADTSSLFGTGKLLFDFFNLYDSQVSLFLVHYYRQFFFSATMTL